MTGTNCFWRQESVEQQFQYGETIGGKNPFNFLLQNIYLCLNTTTDETDTNFELKARENVTFNHFIFFHSPLLDICLCLQKKKMRQMKDQQRKNRWDWHQFWIKGKRAWNSNFNGGIGKRAWNKGFTGNLDFLIWLFTLRHIHSRHLFKDVSREYTVRYSLQSKLTGWTFYWNSWFIWCIQSKYSAGIYDWYPLAKHTDHA